MTILLVLNRGAQQDMKVVVRLSQKTHINRVNQLMASHLEKEAFNLCFTKAQVQQYIPAGTNVKLRPELTLVEDVL